MPTIAKLTKRAIDAAPPSERAYDLFESQLPGFHIRIHPSGKRNFNLHYRSPTRGRSRRLKIADYGVLTLEEARAEARRLLSLIAQGKDPADERPKRQDASAATVAELAERYLSEHAERKNKASSVACVRSNLRAHILPRLGAMRADAVAPEHVRSLFKALADKPVAANRVLSTLSIMFALAEQWDLRPAGSNPCQGVERHRENSRDRYLRPEELGRLGEALARGEGEEGARYQTGCFAIRLLLLTGCRKQEVLRLRWEDFHPDEGFISLVDTKTGASEVSLSGEALKLLERLPRKSRWMFPGARPDAPLRDLRTAWSRLCQEAGLEGLRIHDLRHTYATYALGAGNNLTMIGKLLRHSDPRTTDRYAHADREPLREASDKACEAIANLLKRKKRE